jgi:dienelactone hydrolase
MRMYRVGAIVIYLLGGVPAAVAQDLDPRTPHDSATLSAILSLFRYDAEIPLMPMTLGLTDTELGPREKFVITGVRGNRVPGYLAVPNTASPPFPVVLLLHAGTRSKEAWWSEQVYGGRHLTEDLLEAGFAVVALDAQYHGERSAGIDFLPARSMYFERAWTHRWRDLLIESIGDYRRALDYLVDDSRLDMRRVGAIGHSTGGIMAVGLAAVDDRIGAVVAVVAAVSDPWLFPITPTNLATALHAPVLVLAGSSDQLIALEDTERFYASIRAPKELVVYQTGHLLPPENNQQAAAWFRRFLLEDGTAR